MKTILNYILCIPTLLLLQGCPTNDDDFEPNETVYLNNNSNTVIVDVSIPLSTKPDLPMSSPFRNNELLEASTIKAMSSVSFGIETNSIDEFGLSIALLSREVVETTPWEEIREQNLVLKTFDLTLEELEAMEYTLAYP